MRWHSYFTLKALTSTKPTELVLQEAACEEKELSDSHAGESAGMEKVLNLWDVIAYGIGTFLLIN